MSYGADDVFRVQASAERTAFLVEHLAVHARDAAGKPKTLRLCCHVHVDVTEDDRAGAESKTAAEINALRRADLFIEEKHA